MKLLLPMVAANAQTVYMEFIRFPDFEAFMNGCVEVLAEKEMSLLHITVTNKPHPGLDALKLSALRHNVQTRVLGMGSKTSIGHGGYGFGLKLELLHQELKLLPMDTIVLFTDAFDVLIQDSLDPIREWALAHPTKVLFAAETSKWPAKDLMYPKPLSFPYPYLNSGVFAGRVEAVLSLLQVPYTYLTDDQEYYTRQLLSGDTIVLDHRAQYFQCLSRVAATNIEFLQTGVQIQHNSGLETWKTRPPVLHLNNGMTRIAYFSKCIQSVLGTSYTYLSRQLTVSMILDFSWYNASTIGYAFSALVLLACLYFYSQSKPK